MASFLFSVLYLSLSVILFPDDVQQTTGHSGTGTGIDVKYHRFEWNINPDLPKRISGKVTTYFVTTEDRLALLTFDFNKSSFDNSQLKVTYHGKVIRHFFPESGYTDILNIRLPAPLEKEKLDSVTIYYNGVPPPVDGEAEGCQQKNVAGYPLFYTLSESYEDKDWWPCKADMQDKIDSLTFIFTTPAKYTAAANGKLIETVVSGDKKVTVYKHKYPIASYLVGIAVTQYNIFDRGTVAIGNNKVPVVYYISKGRSVSEEDLATMDESKFLLKEFSRLFGDYPFKNEKYGMYEFGWGGAMEHQTFSAMSWRALQRTSTIAHELMHQWFGDKVTFGTWNDLWLAEGFASYSTVLAPELRGEKEEAIERRRSLKMNANGNLKDMACYIPESSIENSNAIWESDYGSSVYQRGAMVVSMLRTLMGDSGFFRACRNYLDDPRLAYKSASTKDLQKHMEKELDGFGLSTFFNSYVYGNGYPIYGSGGKGNPVNWQSKGTGKIIFTIGTPAKSEGSTVGEYSAVIPLRVTGANGEEKMIVLYDQGKKGVSLAGNGIARNNSRTVETEVGFVPVKVDFDPYYTSLAEGIAVKAGAGPRVKK